MLPEFTALKDSYDKLGAEDRNDANNLLEVYIELSNNFGLSSVGKKIKTTSLLKMIE